MPVNDRPIDSIIIQARHRRDMGDITALGRDIDEIGLLHPIVIRPDGVLIAGERRLRACRALGWTDIPVTVVDIASLVRGELAENTQRKDFLLSEAVAIKRAVEEEERMLAKERQAIGGQLKQEAYAKLAQASKGAARDKIAALAGKGRTSLAKAEAVVEAAEAEPERFGKLLADMDRIGRVDGIFRRFNNMQHADRIRAMPPPLPGGRYYVISIDPPWPYEPLSDSAAYRGVVPYPTMTMEEILGLPIADLAQDDCILWCWITNFHLLEGTAAKVFDAWGFTPRMILTWVKPHFGLGRWLRNQTEHAILATRGNPRVTLTDQTTALIVPKGVHSEKPDEFYALVESLCPAPPGGYLEMFARKPRPGWTTWGDEVSEVING
jgi:N6-adenosine-specific RNA methylase IME4